MRTNLALIPCCTGFTCRHRHSVRAAPGTSENPVLSKGSKQPPTRCACTAKQLLSYTSPSSNDRLRFLRAPTEGRQHMFTRRRLAEVCAIEKLRGGVRQGGHGRLPPLLCGRLQERVQLRVELRGVVLVGEVARPRQLHQPRRRHQRVDGGQVRQRRDGVVLRRQ